MCTEQWDRRHRDRLTSVSEDNSKSGSGQLRGSNEKRLTGMLDGGNIEERSEESHLKGEVVLETQENYLPVCSTFDFGYKGEKKTDIRCLFCVVRLSQDAVKTKRTLKTFLHNIQRKDLLFFQPLCKNRSECTCKYLK